MNLPPIDTTEMATVHTLPVRPRISPEEAPMLAPVDPLKCRHHSAKFEIDMRAGKCFCRDCKEEVSPMFVLEKLMHEESRWRRTRSDYLDELKRLEQRSRTKCQHCGEMTRISRS